MNGLATATWLWECLWPCPWRTAKPRCFFVANEFTSINADRYLDRRMRRRCGLQRARPRVRRGQQSDQLTDSSSKSGGMPGGSGAMGGRTAGRGQVVHTSRRSRQGQGRQQRVGVQ